MAGKLTRGRRATTPARPIIALDTAVLIYYLEDVAPYAAKLERMLTNRDGIQLQLCAVAWAEILAGPWRQGREDLSRELERQLLGVPGLTVTPVGQQEASLAAQLRGTQRLQLPDALILAAAQLGGASVFLTNDRELSRVQGLSLEVKLLEELP